MQEDHINETFLDEIIYKKLFHSKLLKHHANSPEFKKVSKNFIKLLEREINNSSR